MGTEAVQMTRASRPPTSSWVDALNAWFERLPGPVWLAYTIAAVLAAALSAAATISSGPAGTTAVFGLVYYAALPFGVLALISGLDRTANQSLETIRPLLQIGDEELADAHRRLTQIPSRPTLVLTFAGLAVTALGYVLDPVSSGIVGLSPWSLGLRWAWESFVSVLFLVLLFHTVRQLSLIGRIHERLGTIDLFNQTPLYALSRLTSRTASGLIVLLVPSLFLIPSDAGGGFLLITFAWYGGALAMALAAFLLPLRGVHDRLVEEKRRLQAETGHRLTIAIAAIHGAADGGDAAALDGRAKTLAALVAARDVVNRTPTWPWSGGAITGVVSAIVLPIALFLVQRVLSQFI